MATYAIGDVQGCFQPLLQLLELIEFDPSDDTLWFTGDLVNRGPQSLKVLRYVSGLGDKHQVVLGNHDLHLLAVACGATRRSDEDTISYILDAADKDKLLDWLQHRPMLVHDQKLGYTMTHAGLAPAWTLTKAKQLASEVEAVLRSDQASELFKHMYGNQPDLWSDDLTGYDRLRCIINYFTRMRFCYEDGRLNLENKGQVKDKSDDLSPWFDVFPRANGELKIIFGHWAALNGDTGIPSVCALDTGCVWGNKLSAMCLETGSRYSIPCS